MAAQPPPDPPRGGAAAPRRRGGRAARVSEARKPVEPDALLHDEAVLRKGEGDVLLLACGALAREILAVIEANGLRGLDLQCLPAELHNRPERIPERVRAKLRAARAAGYAEVKVVYADCGTGGALDAVCREEGVERIAGPHCYAFFDGLEAFAARAEEEIGAFYLTDFLARHFDTLVWRGMGLDRHPELRQTYFAAYDRLVYLAQTDDPRLTALAEAAAARLGLRFERRMTGYGALAGFIAAAAAVVEPSPNAETDHPANGPDQR